MEKIKQTCFVCQREFPGDELFMNAEVHLKVCKTCRGTTAEKEKVEELLDSLADDLVCGCI